MKPGLTTISLDALTTVTGGKGASTNRGSKKKKFKTNDELANRCKSDGNMLKVGNGCKW
ncbi:MAG: hypothetical protein AB7O24_01055 [Kofleriaceae bacterium]